MNKGDQLLPGTVTLLLTILIAASFVMVAISNWFNRMRPFQVFWRL